MKLNKQLQRREACLGQALMTKEKNQIDYYDKFVL